MNQLWSKVSNRVPLELLFWLTALVLLGFSEMEPSGHELHFTLCPLANLGFEWCPGCGIGRAIAQLLHGNWQESLEQHWFGLPALLILLHRIVVLSRLFLKNKKGLKTKYKAERYV